MADRAADFAHTFSLLRGILVPYGRKMLVQADTPTDFQISDPARTDRIGRPLFVAAVQIKRTYVSYHLMPVYACPDLLKGLSPALRKRMQGKACFNFTRIDPAQVKELKALTKTGIERFRQVKLPWSGD